MCSNQLSYSGIRKSVFQPFRVQIYSKISFPQNYCTIFSQKMYLCIIDTNQHHDGTTTYPPHTLGSLRFRNGGAGTTGLYPRHLGFRHDPRNRRPCEPYLHGREPRQYARSDPRRGHHLRLHGTPIHQASDPPRRENHRQGDIRPGQPPRRPSPRNWASTPPSGKKGRHAHHPGQCHAAHEIHRGALPGRCGRRAAAPRPSTPSPTSAPGNRYSPPSAMQTPRAKPSGSNCARWNRAGC